MLLAIDIGNSNIVIGGIAGEEIVFEARLSTDYLKTSDEYGVEIYNILNFFQINREDVEDCIISSVVPPVLNAVRTGLMKLVNKEPMVVGPGIKTGLNVLMDDPASVGADLIVAAVAALQDYKAPLILIDMGTATTITVVDEHRSFVGGCIIPGVRVSSDALTSRTAQLPGIQLDRPGRAIGKNTIECMRSGVMYSAADGIEGVVNRMEKELGMPATVIATGGIAQFITPLCSREILLERDLLLKGLNVIYKKNVRTKK